MSARTRPRLVISCEHGGHRIPRAHRALFEGECAVLASHRGWDPGALVIARRIAARCDAPLHAVTTSRLLVDANRSPTHPRVFSTYTRGLPVEAKRALLARYHAPHHAAVEASLRPLLRHGRALHLSVHTFTPVLGDAVRDVDLGVLYDPRRAFERVAASALARTLVARFPALRVRRNAPYRGVSDGLTKILRRAFPETRYAGIELEVSQRFLEEPPGLPALARGLAEAVAETLDALFA